jgi:hypothetical protein
VDSYHRRCIRQSFLRPFGYFLGTTLAQQYGLSSEGLDVTKSLEVAAFFAAFESSSDFVSTPKAGTGVIYRFPYTAPDIRYHRINDYDYYSLPSIIDTEDVLYRFERRGLAIGDVLKCFEAYFGAVFLDGLQNTDLFFLPEGALANSRVTRQKALIILPDELRRDLPSGTAFRFVEDLAKRDGVEKYYFHHTGRSPESVKLQRQDLWPRDDPFVQIIVAILTAVYPLSAFLPDILPQRLDLIDAGYDHADFLQLCEKFAISHHMVLYDHDAMMATRSGTLIL